MKLSKQGNLITNKSGRIIAIIRPNRIIIKQKDFKRAIKKIRELSEIKNFAIV